MCVLSLGFAFTASAQYQMAATMENGAPAFIPITENTGTAVVNGLQVMVNDGSNPSISWDDGAGNIGTSPIMGSGIPQFLDPDVVIEPNGGTDVLVVYVADIAGLGPEVVYEMWQWTGTMLSPAIGPTQVGSGINVKTVNVDVSTNFNAPIVWDDSGAIFASNFSFGGFFAGPIQGVTAGCPTFPGDFHAPDVAVLEHTSSGQEIVSYTYLKENGANTEWYVKRSSMALLNAGGVLFNCAASTNTVLLTIPTSMVVDKPRIAAPWDYGALDAYDVEVVWSMDDGSNHRVIGANHNTSYHGFGNFPLSSLTSPFGLTTCGGQSSRPAVTYSGDLIIVAWDYFDCMGILNGDRDIIVRQLHWDGSFVFSDYSVANMNLPTDQMYTSVAGRYMYSTSTANTYFCWHDAGFTRIMYKNAPYYNQNLMDEYDVAFADDFFNEGTDLQQQATGIEANGAIANALQVWPNPTNATLNFSAIEGAQQYAIHSITGAIVVERTSLDAGSQTTLQVADLDAGAYLLMLYNAEGQTHQQRFIKQ